MWAMQRPPNSGPGRELAEPDPTRAMSYRVGSRVTCPGLRACPVEGWENGARPGPSPWAMPLEEDQVPSAVTPAAARPAERAHIAGGHDLLRLRRACENILRGIDLDL